MKYNPDIHHRRSIRLQGWDYSRAGWYSITLCTQDRLRLFGKIVNGEMRLNEAGNVIAACWHDLPNHYTHVVLDVCMIMPNHFHGIVNFTDTVDTICRENGYCGGFDHVETRTDPDGGTAVGAIAPTTRTHIAIIVIPTDG